MEQSPSPFRRPDLPDSIGPYDYTEDTDDEPRFDNMINDENDYYSGVSSPIVRRHPIKDDYQRDMGRTAILASLDHPLISKNMKAYNQAQNESQAQNNFKNLVEKTKLLHMYEQKIAFEARSYPSEDYNYYHYEPAGFSKAPESYNSSDTSSTSGEKRPKKAKHSTEWTDPLEAELNRMAVERVQDYKSSEVDDPQFDESIDMNVIIQNIFNEISENNARLSSKDSGDDSQDYLKDIKELSSGNPLYQNMVSQLLEARSLSTDKFTIPQVKINVNEQLEFNYFKLLVSYNKLVKMVSNKNAEMAVLNHKRNAIITSMILKLATSQTAITRHGSRKEKEEYIALKDSAGLPAVPVPEAKKQSSEKVQSEKPISTPSRPHPYRSEYASPERAYTPMRAPIPVHHPKELVLPELSKKLPAVPKPSPFSIPNNKPMEPPIVTHKSKPTTSKLGSRVRSHGLHILPLEDDSHQEEAEIVEKLWDSQSVLAGSPTGELDIPEPASRADEALRNYPEYYEYVYGKPEKERPVESDLKSFDETEVEYNGLLFNPKSYSTAYDRVNFANDDQIANELHSSQAKDKVKPAPSKSILDDDYPSSKTLHLNTISSPSASRNVSSTVFDHKEPEIKNTRSQVFPPEIKIDPVPDNGIPEKQRKPLKRSSLSPVKTSLQELFSSNRSKNAGKLKSIEHKMDHTEFEGSFQSR